jgi:hypothetical protein
LGDRMKRREFIATVNQGRRNIGLLFIRVVGRSRVSAARPPRCGRQVIRAVATRSAELIVFTSSIVTVIGPTPPGTGVM